MSLHFAAWRAAAWLGLWSFARLALPVHSQWSGLFDSVTSPISPPVVVLWRTSYHYMSKDSQAAVQPLLAVGEVWRELRAGVEARSLEVATLVKAGQASPACTSQLHNLYATVKEAQNSLHMLSVSDPEVGALQAGAHGLSSLEEEASVRVWQVLYSWLHTQFLDLCEAGTGAMVQGYLSLLTYVELASRNFLLFVNAKLVRSRLSIPSASLTKLRYATEDTPVFGLRRYEILHELARDKHRFVEIGALELDTSLNLLRHRPNLTVVAIDPWSKRSHDEAQALKAKLDPYPNAVALRHLGEEVPDIARVFGSGCFDAFFVDANQGEAPYFCHSTLDAWVNSGLVCKGALIAGHDYRVGWEKSVAECAHRHAAGREINLGHDWLWWFHMD